MGWPAARSGSSGVPSCPPQVHCSSPPPLSTAALGSQMLPPALVLQNQCLLPRELSQCPTPVLPLPHAEQSPGTTPAKHRVPTCFPQAPWSFTVPCRLHALLSPPHPSGKGRGPPAPPGAAWCSSCNWDRGQHRPSSQKSTALHLPPAPGLVPSSITALPWFLPIAPPGLGPPGPAPHKAGAAAALCHLLHHSFPHKEHDSRCLFTLGAFSRGQLCEGWCCLCGLVQPGPGLGLSEHEVCACVLYLGVFL